jgi:muconolactone delta-isomerase
MRVKLFDSAHLALTVSLQPQNSNGANEQPACRRVVSRALQQNGTLFSLWRLTGQDDDRP